MPPTRVSRRGLLEGALGAVGALVVAERGASPAAGAEPARYARVPWGRLAAGLDGRLVRPGQARYLEASLLYNSRFANLRPAAIAYCRGSDDVARCLDFTRSHGVPFALRSGGHSYGGYSSTPGLIVDVSGLGAVEVDPRRRTAKVGAGAQLIDLYDAVARHSLVVPGGTCPTVGVAGLTMGGGVGVLARRYGLTCDHVIGARAVTAAGDQIGIGPDAHADLWWALRGGGGGNFAAVTSFRLSLEPAPPLALFSLQYPWSRAAAVLEGWQHWIAGEPDETWSNCQLFAEGTAGLLVQVNGVYCGSPPELERRLSRLAGLVGAASASFVGGDDYLEAMKVEAGCASLTIAVSPSTATAGPSTGSRATRLPSSTATKWPGSRPRTPGGRARRLTRSPPAPGGCGGSAPRSSTRPRAPT
ncbi:MAG: hypothetical protein B7Z69_06490 [Actinobacteria bacterium 21-73-9]|nr:MAG: hypothetical protein B7Z69_06490 [Actinobacteria bacterium 21-73-9]